MGRAIGLASTGLTAPARCATGPEARLDGQGRPVRRPARGVTGSCRKQARESIDGSERLAADELPGQFDSAGSGDDRAIFGP